MTSYYEKILVTQGIAEVWRYEKLNTKGGNNKDGKTSDGIDPEFNYRMRQKKRRNRIRQLVCANFDKGSKFITLTFRDGLDFDIRDVKSCNRYMKNFVLRVLRRYPEFQYLWVIEFQDKNGRGAIHYHMICNLPYIKKKELAELWGAGFIKIERIDKVDNVGAYIIKYMCKDTEDTRLMGENAYGHSKGLQEPEIFCTWGDPASWSEWHDRLQNETPSYFREYESESAGHIEYYQYKNLNLKPSENQ